MTAECSKKKCIYTVNASRTPTVCLSVGSPTEKTPLIIASYCHLASEKKLVDLNKQQKTLQNDLEMCKADEMEFQDKINEDAKELEKISTKISSLQKKVVSTRARLLKLLAADF